MSPRSPAGRRRNLARTPPLTSDGIGRNQRRRHSVDNQQVSETGLTKRETRELPSKHRPFGTSEGQSYPHDSAKSPMELGSSF
jgi:hypothetical protein